MKLFFACDVHGSEKCFKKFLNAGKFYKVDVIMLSGDITGKFVQPLVERTDGSYESNFLGVVRTARGQEELAALEKDVKDTGYYPYRTTRGEVDQLVADKARVDKLFSQLMLESVSNWMRIAEERLRDSGIRCFIMPGNDDRPEIDAVFRESGCVENPDGKVVKVGDHEMISSGNANITPWNCPRDIPEEKLADIIQNMAVDVRDMSHCIFNFHCPPYNSQLDLAPELDSDLRPVTRMGNPNMIPVGSHSVRSAIEKHQPLLGLHGHIHESKGEARIGRTLCLNPGSDYAVGVLNGAIIVLKDGRVKEYGLTTG